MISIRTLIYRLQKLGEGCGDGTPVAIDGMEWVNGIVRVETPETAELREAVENLERENRRLREALSLAELERDNYAADLNDPRCC